MHGAHEFLRNLALILSVAAVTTVLFQRLRQPVVLGYLLAGCIVGPHVPVPLVVDPAFAQTLSELGVVLLMFSLGLEFSLRKLLRLGPTAGVIAVIQCSLMVWLGYVVGLAFGWTHLESIFAGAAIAISSTTIIVKAFAEQGLKGRFTDLVFGVLIVEDLIAILLLAILTPVAKGSGVSTGELVAVTGKLLAFLVGFVVVGLLVVPRLVRSILALNRPETTLVASVGICFASALLAQTFGYSVALGAFLGGSLVAESGQARQVEHLIQPVRDMFAAIFFVAVGMLIEPALVAQHWVAIAVLTLVVVLGKVVGVSFAAFLTGHGTRTSLQAGMSLSQIGEFSFIIIGVGVSLGAVGSHLYPIAVAVSAATTLLTPWLIRASGPTASLVDRKLPRPFQTFAGLYGSWLEELKAARERTGPSSELRRLAGLLLVDVACLAALAIGTSVSFAQLMSLVRTSLGVGEGVAHALVLAAAAALSLPFWVGIARSALALGEALAIEALPRALPGRVDLAAAPRRALARTLQLVILLLVGVPLVAITQPFLPSFEGAALLVLAVVALGAAFWRSTTHLQGHVRAGAQVIAEVLARQTREEPEAAVQHALDEVHRVLPGLGAPVPFRLPAESPAVGRTLAALNVRSLTGATVLAITRGESEVLVPSGKEVLQAEDVLALAGTQAAVEAARQLLLTGGPPPAARSTAGAPPPPEDGGPPASEARASSVG